MSCADLLAMISLMGDSQGFKLAGPGDISPKEHGDLHDVAGEAEEFPFIPDFFVDSSKFVSIDAVGTFQEHPRVMGQNNLSKLPVKVSGAAVSLEEQVEDFPLLEFESKFHQQYWRNDRKNIQCFPYCPEFGDYLSMRLQSKEHGRTSCNVPVIVRAPANIDFRGVHCVSRICFATDSLELKPGQKFPAADYERINEHLWKGNVKAQKPHAAHREIHFATTKWKVYKTQCKTRKPLNMQRSTKYAFEAFLIRRRDDGDYTTIAYAMSSPFELASTRELSKQLHAIKTQSHSGKKRTLVEDNTLDTQDSAKKTKHI